MGTGSEEKGESDGRRYLALGKNKGMRCPKVNTSTVVLLVDDKAIQLSLRPNQSGPVIIFEAPEFKVDVNMHTGRTVRVQVIGVGFDLMPGVPNQYCYGDGKWNLNTESVVQCWYENPVTITIPAGPPIEHAWGLQYFGAQVPGNCQFMVVVRVKRAMQDKCPVMCKDESVLVPAGEVQALVNDIGFQYNLPRRYRVECNKDDSQANRSTADYIRTLIRTATSSCDDPGVQVVIGPSGQTPGCVKVSIKNSPLKFAYIKIDGEYIPFSTLKC